MGLAGSQRLLARLSVDEALRARVAADPEGVAAEYGLGIDEVRALDHIAVAEFARSLVRKRRGEVETLLPLTLRALGPVRFAALFRLHASGFVPAGIKRHRDDAVAFAGSLTRQAEGPPWLGDLARLEAASLLAFDPARRWSALWIGYRPTDLARAANDRDFEPKPRPSFVAWFRLSPRGRLRRVIL